MKRILLIGSVALLAGLQACQAPRADTAMPDHHTEKGPMHEGMAGHGMMASMQPMAMATLSPTQGNTVRGLVMFHSTGPDVIVHARFTGLTPYSEHGFHLHDIGNCASPDGSSAGGHFNPGGTAHGPQDGAHHAGDMPGLKADANGVIDQTFTLHGISLKDGPNSIDGRSVVLHANPDDYRTQPTGNSGPRIACGVVVAHP